MIRRWSPRLLLFVALLLVAGLAASQSEDADRAARKERKQRARVLLKESLAAIEAGDHAAAQASLGQLLAADPANPDAYYQLGRIHLAEADSSAALAVIQTGVERAPLSLRLGLLLARLHIARNEPELAAPLLERTLMLRPREPEALYLRGLAQIAAGDSAAAAADWRLALQSALEEAGP